MITIYTAVDQSPEARATFVRHINRFLRGNLANRSLTDRQVALRLTRQWRAEGMYDGTAADLIPLVQEARS